MAEPPINLRKEAARRTGDSRRWSVLDMLRDAIDRIERGEILTDKAVLICNNSKDSPDNYERHDCFYAGVTNLEALGLLHKGLLETEVTDG